MHRISQPSFRPACIIYFALLLGLTGHVGAGHAAAGEPYSPEQSPRPRVLMDYYHHSLPTLKIGKNIVTGNYADNLGRYGLDDFYHTNGFDPLFLGLEKEFALVVHQKPFNEEQLRGADIVVIFTPDSPQIKPETPVISDAEIDALTAFVERGGSLMLMVNSHHPTEKFEHPQLKKLFHRFGLDWLEDDTKYVDIHIGRDHPYFYDMDVFHYGAGATLKYLPSEFKPLTLLQVHGDVGDEHVKGPGLALVRCGKGKVIACGDTGSWGANMARPWAENARFLEQMFRYAKRDTGIRLPRYKQGESHAYRLDISQTLAMPKWNTLLKIPQPHTKDFVPRKKTRIPYLESSADVTLTCTGVGGDGVMDFKAGVDDWRRFENPEPGADDLHVIMKSNRQGSATVLHTSDPSLRPLSPLVVDLIGFVPNDGVRKGDRWKKWLQLDVPSVRLSAPGTVRPVEGDMCYARDEKIKGRNCRVLLTKATAWLDQLDISIDDLLPKDALDRNNPRHALHHPRGGRLIYKREQWVDRDSGVVVRCKTQCRYVVWIRDLDKPMPETVAGIDNDTVTAVARVTRFELR